MARLLFLALFPKEPIMKIYLSFPLSLAPPLNDLSPLTEFSPTGRRAGLSQRPLTAPDFTGVGGWVEVAASALLRERLHGELRALSNIK